MALKVWLPLDGDLRNLGISNIEITNHGATINNSGKIGKCYQFDNSSSYIELNCSELYKILNGGTQPFSVCFWVNQIDSSRAIILGDYSVSGGNNFNIELKANHDLRWYWGTPDIGISAMNVGINTWTHVTFTYSGTVLKGYINGIEKYTNTITLNEKNRTSGSYYLGRDGRTGTTTLNGYLNDFRIYDHCLPAAEIKEISQGLVLHYKLNNGLFGNPNLYTGSEKFSGTWVNGGNWTTSAETFQNFVVKEKTTSWGGIVQNVSCALNDIFTISFYGKVENGGTIESVHRSNLGNVTTGLSLLGGNFKDQTYWVRTTDDGSNWKRYWATVQIASSDITYLQWRLENRTTNKKIQLCGIKIERGSVATAWCPADSELNIDRTIIQDSSGYGHNGIVVNSVAISSDTPRYNNSLNLINANSMINCGRAAMVTDSITVNFWCKYSSWGNPVSCTEGGGWNFENNGGSLTMPVYIKSVGYIHSKNGEGAEQITPATYANAWHMFTGVYNRTEGYVALYIDGELKQKNTAISALNEIQYHASNNIWIGAEATGSATSANNGMAGLFSDFRIYCTPLLDSDIKKLYNTSVSIGKNGDIHAFELVEENINLFSAVPWTKSYSTHSSTTNLFNTYNSNNEPEFTMNSTSAGSNFIIITPGIYEYDYTISVNTGNQFYIGFERYDENKTSRSNAACVYTYTTKPTADVVKQRYKGVVDLSTDGVNPIKYITLRILNGWSGTTNGVTGKATIHNFSLKLKSAAVNSSFTSRGQLISGEDKEYNKASIYKDHIVEANQFIER